MSCIDGGSLPLVDIKIMKPHVSWNSRGTERCCFLKDPFNRWRNKVHPRDELRHPGSVFFVGDTPNPGKRTVSLSCFLDRLWVSRFEWYVYDVDEYEVIRFVSTVVWVSVTLSLHRRKVPGKILTFHYLSSQENFLSTLLINTYYYIG